MLSGTRSALAPCRPTRALCRRHTSIFLPRTASGRSACTLAAKFPNASRTCGSDFGRAHRNPSAAFRTASRSGSRHSARQAPQDLPRCSDGANPVAAGSPSRVLRLPTCGRRSPEPMRPPPYAARPWHHGSGSRQHETPSTSNPSARSQPPSKPPSFDESEPEPAPYGNPQRRQAHWPVV